MPRNSTVRRCLLGAFGLAMLAAPAAAAPGDTHRITGERVNLRAGPSDGSSVRSTIRQGDEVLELRQEGSWTGVRVMRTGEEGWIFSDLLRRSSVSTLNEAKGQFARYSSSFDRMVGNIDRQLGYRFAERVEQGENGLLRVTPTQEWLANTSREGKIYAALALYQMWKNHNDGRPVNLALGARGANPITIEDGNDGPLLDLPALMGATR